MNAVLVTKKVNHRKYPITLGILNLLGGSISLDISSGFATFCFIVALICFIIAFLMRTKYILRLRTRFGENIPLISTNQSELLAIREAILQALGQRTIL